MNRVAMPAPPRIAYVGPIAQPGLPAKGGYESASRRLIDLVRGRDFTVLEFPYLPADGSTVRKSATYARSFAGIALGLWRRRAEWDVMHITPLRRQFLKPELGLCRLARALGKAVLVDIRAGALMVDYAARSAAYRADIDRLIADADLVTYEGLEYAPFVAARRSGPHAHLPNFAAQASRAEDGRKPPGGAEPVRMVMLGRVVPEKGVEVGIEAARLLRERGRAAELTIIGSGAPAYVAALRERTADRPVRWLGEVGPADVARHLAAQHVFLFPTVHEGEGHSNALTEAMVAGCVPVVSANGFNASVVGEAGRVLPKSATGTDYAAAVDDIVASGSWPALSAAATRRIEEHFSAATVVPALCRLYGELTPARA